MSQSRPAPRQPHRDEHSAPMLLAGRNRVQIGPTLRERHTVSQENGIGLLEREDLIPGKRPQKTPYFSLGSTVKEQNAYDLCCSRCSRHAGRRLT